MPRCYMTGVELVLEESYTLNMFEAREAVRELRSKLTALENLCAQLGTRDNLEMKDRQTGKPFTLRQHRLVSATIAGELAKLHPGRTLFVRYPEWKDIYANYLAEALGKRHPPVSKRLIKDTPESCDENSSSHSAAPGVLT